MNQITKKLATAEMHCIEQKYEHLRIHNSNARNKLVTSIEQNGQLMPVVTVLTESQHWILIDGYLRMQALKQLGKDTIEIEVWDCDTTEALLSVIRNHCGRNLEVLEEALLLRELHTQHELSHRTIAARTGRDHSWVTRRLSLLDFLSDDILQALRNGDISLWAASRILAPVARATIEHANLMLDYLAKHHHSTRELQLFYQHYQRSNQKERSNMVNNLELFFKTQKILQADKQTNLLKEGPAGKWQHKLNQIHGLLLNLSSIAPTIFYQKQELEDIHKLTRKFNKIKAQITELDKTIEEITHARSRNTPNDNMPT